MKNLLLTLTCLLSLSSFANTYYFVEFTDKNESNYSVDTPTDFLSQKAIERRTKWHIAIDEKDLPVCQDYINSITQTGATVTLHSKWLNGVIVITNNTNQINTIEDLECVKKTQIIKETSYRAKSRKKKKYTKSKIQPQTPYGQAYNQAQNIHANYLHELGYKGETMIIAVIDAGFTGVDTATGFDSLRTNNRLLGGYDFVDLDNEYYHGSEHGTRVLSCITGNMPNTYIGTAPNCSVYLFRTEDVESEWPIEMYNWIAAVERSDSLGVDLITSSLGYYGFDNSKLDIPYAHLDGETCPNSIVADIAVNKGIMMVNSAGNEANNDWQYIVTPCDAKNIVCVGAVTPELSHASFSSIGPSADGRIKPDIMALGGPAITFNQRSNPNTSNGTSFACPIAAGMITCLMQAFPNTSPLEIVQLLRQTASQNDTPDNEMGYGIANAQLAYKWLDDHNAIQETTISAVGDFYPNPSHDVLHFMPDKLPNSIQVLDLSGRLLMQHQAQFIQNIDVSHLQQGAYILTYIIGTQTNIASFIKD